MNSRYLILKDTRHRIQDSSILASTDVHRDDVMRHKIHNFLIK